MLTEPLWWAVLGRFPPHPAPTWLTLWLFLLPAGASTANGWNCIQACITYSVISVLTIPFPQNFSLIQTQHLLSHLLRTLLLPSCYMTAGHFDEELAPWMLIHESLQKALCWKHMAWMVRIPLPRKDFEGKNEVGQLSYGFQITPGMT